MAATSFRHMPVPKRDSLQRTSSVPLPKSILGALDRLHPNWTFAQMSAEDKGICPPKAPFLSAVVWSDFDGDSNTDYGVLIVQNASTSAIVFLKRGNSYKEFALFRTKKPQERAPDLLGVLPRGTRYFDQERNKQRTLSQDALAVVYCEASTVAYVFNGAKFHRIVVGD